MSEQTLRDRLSDLVEQQPPMRSGSADDLRRGHHRLRVRRALGVGASTAAVAALALVGALVQHVIAPASPPVTRFASGDAGIVERCTKVDNGALDPTTFGPGSRVLTSQTSSSGDVEAVVVSAAGTTWGSCWLSGNATTEFNGSASAYPMKAGRPGASHQETAGMSFGRGQFWYVDRFPSDVARVSVRVTKDHVVTARAVDGFVAFAVDVPGLDMNDSPSFDVTLYDADGKVLADKAMAHGDDTLPRPYRSLVPGKPLPHGGAGR